MAAEAAIFSCGNLWVRRERMTIRERLERKREYLTTAYVEGVSTCDLGREMGCSNASIYVFLRDVCGVEMRNVKIITAALIAKVKERHERGMTAYAITKELELSKSTAERILKQLGIDISAGQKKRDDPLKDHEEEILQLYCSGLGSHLISKRFNCQDASIVRFLKKRKVDMRPLRQHSVNEHFFDTIDNEVKSYILGFWYADGCNEPNVPVVSLSITDEDILREIGKEMGFSGPIEHKEPRGKAVLPLFRIRIGSRIMSDALIRQGCMARKTYHCKFPTDDQVPFELMRHFVRGLNDGDGTITTSARSDYAGQQWTTRIVGTEAECRGISAAVSRHLGFVACVCPIYVGNSHTTWAFSITGAIQIRRYLDWFYTDATICLERKRLKYQEFLAYINQR